MSDVLLRANERMNAVLARGWPERARGLPYATPDDALIMASIIEKETGREDERGKISRVFVSRLQRSMRLQTDPAVIYGLGDTFDGNLTRAQLEADSPYNTYKMIGLPPTPIALPGLASIEAALHPDDGDFLYFVARGDGSSEFSATLDEHLAAVRRYQLGGERPVTRGKFITFEGTEGVGKTTNMDFVAQTLVARGIRLVRTREPGGTPMAERVRAILLDPQSEPIDPGGGTVARVRCSRPTSGARDQAGAGVRLVGAVRSIHRRHLCIPGRWSRVAGCTNRRARTASAG